MDDFFNEIMEKYETSRDAFQTIHTTFRDDVEFSLLGRQWDSEKERKRRIENRVSKVYNKCSVFVNYVVNQSIKNTPSIKTISNGMGNKEVTKIIDGLIKNIQSKSNAETKYNAALQDAVAGGIGVLKVDIDSRGEIVIRHIKDPTNVYPDPEAQESDLSDANWLFYVKSMPIKQFTKVYPNAEQVDVTANRGEWYCSESIQIAEYWEKQEDGSVAWYIISGNEILDSSFNEFGQNEYSGKHIPFAFITGIEVSVNGERHFKSLIRDIKTYQEEYNYIKSEKIDLIANTAKSPFLVADEALGEYEKQWETANRAHYPYLLYKSGKEKPQRMDPPNPPAGLIEASNTLEQDMRSAVGIRDPLLDIPASQSGKAIQLQMSQGNIATVVWQDHLNTTIKHIGRIIVDLIPSLYNYPHIMQILGNDNSPKQVPVMTQMQNPETGEVEGFDLSGEYDVIISTGASYADQKTESFEKLLELARIYPQLMPVAGDLLVAALDINESSEISDRLKAMMPPQVLQATAQGNNKQAQMMVMQQQMQKAMAQIEQMTQILNQKQMENQQLQEALKSKEQLEYNKLSLDAQKAQEKNELDMQKAMLDSQTKIEQENIKADVASEQTEANIMIKQLELQLEQLKASQSQTTFYI